MTSLGQWTPMYTRETATSAASGHHSQADPGIMRDPAIAYATAIAACPEGNDAVCGRASMTVIDASTSNGRGRSKRGFKAYSLSAHVNTPASSIRQAAARLLGKTMLIRAVTHQMKPPAPSALARSITSSSHGRRS